MGAGEHRDSESAMLARQLPEDDQALADLATSLDHVVRRYLRERGFDTQGLVVEADVRPQPRPEVDGQVLAIEIRLPAQRRPGAP